MRKACKERRIKGALTVLILSACFCLIRNTAFADESEEIFTLQIDDNYGFQSMADADIPTNDELFAGYAESILYEGFTGEEYLEVFEESDEEPAIDVESPEFSEFFTTPASGSAALAATNGYLNSGEKAIYNSLKNQISKVASGNASSTVFTVTIASEGYAALNSKISWTFSELGVSGTDDPNFEQQFLDAILREYGLTDRKTVDTLLVDCPYELYWFEKTIGYKFSFEGMTYVTTGNGVKIYNLQLKYWFVVSGDFASSKIDTIEGLSVHIQTDTGKTSATKNTVNNAKQVVASCANCSDYEKLCVYRDYICDAVSYNRTAMSSSYLKQYGYGNPWQIIYVFDGNPSTNVVCEGYSKAFKYLCDLTTFNADVRCYLMSGMMSGATGAGTHMWNIVHMSDDRNYLVDITNSDSGSVGSSGGVFMNGYTSVVEDFNPPFEQDPANICESKYYSFKIYVYNSTVEVKYYCFEKIVDMLGSVSNISAYDFACEHTYFDGKCSKCGDILDKMGARLAGYQMSLAGDITVNFYMELTGYSTEFEEDYLRFTIGDEVQKVSIAEAEKKTVSGKQYYVFPCHVSAKQMNDTIHAQLYEDYNDKPMIYYNPNVSEDSLEATEYTFTVKDYAESIINGSYTSAQKNFAKALLLYGGSTQEYFEYNTGNLASDGISLATDSKNSTIRTNTKSVAAAFSGTDASFDGMKLILKNTISMKIYFTDTGSGNGKYSFTVNGEKVDASCTQKSYVLTLDNIKPSELGTLKTVNVINSSGETVGVLKVCPMSYVREAVASDSQQDDAFCKVCRALYVLWKNTK